MCEKSSKFSNHSATSDFLFQWKTKPPKKTSGWWLNHPSQKYARQNGNLPQIGVKIKNVWNHHLDIGVKYIIKARGEVCFCFFFEGGVFRSRYMCFSCAFFNVSKKLRLKKVECVWIFQFSKHWLCIHTHPGFNQLLVVKICFNFHSHPETPWSGDISYNMFLFELIHVEVDDLTIFWFRNSIRVSWFHATFWVRWRHFGEEIHPTPQ